MTEYYQTAGIKVFPKTGKAVLEGEPVSVRPKTFQLLEMLITSKEVVSKQQILSEIWDDVVVDDQVIFQSVKEIRKLFAGQDVIKTFPRKGYAWVADVEFHSETETLSQVSVTPDERKKRHLPFATKLASVSVLVIVSALFLFFLIPNEKPITGSVVVLPIQNNIEDTNHQWVRYGAMDQLIQRLSSGENLGVLNTDYVMEVMKRADLPQEEYERRHIEQIFKVSGTRLVVESVLTGNSGDYQLVYTLHQPTNIERGAVLGDNLSVVIDELAGVVNQKLGRKVNIDTADYHSAFANEILAEAIELKHQGDHLGARQLLEAMIVTEPENLTAKRLLVELALDNRDSATAELILSEAIPEAIAAKNKKELVRLQFFAAIHIVRAGDIEKSQQMIKLVESNAQSINDWLYLAYASEFKGVLNQQMKNFDLAQESFNQALEYHQVLQCPLGRSKGFMFLSGLAHAQGDANAAKEHAQQSLVITEQRELTSYKPEVEAWLDKLNEEL
jgi:DNA-binding winged helix-turn-helix (wHTH) protein/tetratricopeptide (TPR) repeat protein